MRLLLLATMVVLSCGVMPGQSPATGSTAPAPDITVLLQSMQGAINAQQKQILEQQKQMERQQQEIEKLKTQLTAQSNTLISPEHPAQLVDASLKTISPDMAIVQSDADRIKESPLSFRIGGNRLYSRRIYRFRERLPDHQLGLCCHHQLWRDSFQQHCSRTSHGKSDHCAVHPLPPQSHGQIRRQ